MQLMVKRKGINGLSQGCTAHRRLAHGIIQELNGADDRLLLELVHVGENLLQILVHLPVDGSGDGFPLRSQGQDVDSAVIIGWSLGYELHLNKGLNLAAEGCDVYAQRFGNLLHGRLVYPVNLEQDMAMYQGNVQASNGTAVFVKEAEPACHDLEELPQIMFQWFHHLLIH
jgi:hypothetical protein